MSRRWSSYPRAGAVAACMVAGVAAAGVTVAVSPAAAQQAPPGQADALREQLAVGYLRLELAVQAAAAAAPAAGPDRRRLNQAFDALTLQFFGGNLQAALASLDSLAQDVVAGSAAVPDLDERARGTLQWLTAQQRTLEWQGGTTAYLLHLPEGPAPATGWPVVVAVHGAGGDERMFFGGYGAGVIRALADRHGVAVVTPRAPLATEAIVALVDALAAQQPLDTARVALLGHSMGAAVAGRAALERPARFRAVACIAGSCGAGQSAGAPDALIVAGELDPLFRVQFLASQAEALAQGGRTVEFQRLADEGHTLVVGAALPAVMEWLVERLATAR
jgi:predicted esterase